MHSSEHHREAEADAVLVTAGGWIVVHTPHILYLEEAQDTAHASRDFPIWHTRIHDVRLVGEVH